MLLTRGQPATIMRSPYSIAFGEDARCPYSGIATCLLSITVQLEARNASGTCAGLGNGRRKVGILVRYCTRCPYGKG
jgi:hypothetical protein